MISLSPVLARLREKPAGFPRQWFRGVEGAAEISEISRKNLPRLPACWVVRTSDRPRHKGERLDAVTFIFDVVLAVDNQRVHGRGETDDLLLEYRQAVRGRLLGWVAAADAEPLRWTGGRALEYVGGALYWADRYEFEMLIENYLPDPTAYAGLDYEGDGL
uniref:Uncharacterized protein n=1 Tax=Candidatus Kentrum sp. LPFa TaxID=2126335 RepID=A0A450X1I7_9GAMM|nr:MAG: hypothetical protein BECKLPF1236B_GA0070989_13432 [Candidatus Kentron sp. LPFa]